MWPALTWETERERKRPSLKCFAVLCMICTVNPKRSSPSVYMIPQWNFAPIYRISFLIKTGMTCAAKEISFRHQVNPKYIEKHMEEVSEWKSFQYLIIRWMDVSCCIPPLNNIIIIDHHHHHHHHHHHYHRSSEEQSTVKHLQLDRTWAVRTISFSEKYLLASISVFLDLVGKGLMRSSWWSSPVEGLTQHVDVSGFIDLHAQNVAKELELTWVDSVIVKTFSKCLMFNIIL